MFWSAVNLAIASLAYVGQAAPMSHKEEAIWQKLRTSFVTTLQAGRPVGTAAMIDQEGLFIAYRSSVPTRSIDARTFDGQLIRLQTRATDGTTQFVLLGIVGHLPSNLRPLNPPSSNVVPGKSLFAVTPLSTFRAFLVADGRPGVVGPSRRVLPLSEIRFESPSQAFGGALLVSYDGELIGVLGASLERRDASQTLYNNQLLNANTGRFGGAGLGGGEHNTFSAKTADPMTNQMQMGPGELTVAYSVSPIVMRRVFDGFCSPGREVTYPALGVFCKDTPDGGALVQRVISGGSAEAAGIRPGDIILDVAGNNIRNQIDFGLAMNRQKIGSVITIRIRRGGSQGVLNVVVGKIGGGQ